MDKTPLPDPRGATLRHEKGIQGNAQRAAVLFHVGSEMFAVDSSFVLEIVPMARLSVPGGAPSVLAGFLNLAGRPIPVIRLHRLLSLPETSFGLYTQIIILRDGDGRSVGWIVDRVAQIVPLREADIMSVPEKECFKDCTKGFLTFGDAHVPIMIPDRVLLEQERRRITEFREMEQARLRELEQSAT
jgi:purine-binding chemotaxis protein CheW